MSAEHKDKELLVYGAGGHGRVVADVATTQGWGVVRFADRKDSEDGSASDNMSIVSIGVEATISYCLKNSANMIVAIGDNRIRASLYGRFLQAGVTMALVRHPNSCVARDVTIGPGTVIMGGVVINTGSLIGENAIINTQASLDHDNRLSSHVHVSPGVHTGGTVVIGEGAHLGIGCSVRNNIRIGSWSVLGVGSVVVKDVPDNVVAYGSPARVVSSASE